jgi:hypothetical protein
MGPQKGSNTMSQGNFLDGGRELEILRQKDPLIGSLISRLITGVNRTAQNSGVGSMGELEAPPPVDSTSVQGTYDANTNTLTAPGEILHAVHTHNAPLNRGIQYITEIDTDPGFPNPHPIDTGSSRTVVGVSLPTKNGSGQTAGYYLRVTAQMPGSIPSQPTVFGGLKGPTKIVMTGSTDMALLPSQSGGTARPGQGGKGIGPVVARGPVGGPKRKLT